MTNDDFWRTVAVGVGVGIAFAVVYEVAVGVATHLTESKGMRKLQIREEHGR